MAPPPNNVETKFYDLPFHRRNLNPAGLNTTFHSKQHNSNPFMPRSSSMFSRHDRKWRWWHYLTLLLIVFGVFQALALITGSKVLHGQQPALRIALRQYPPIPYKQLDASTLPIDRGAIVYHVSKEFGPATSTQLGVTVTALAAAQQQRTEANVRVVMPYYSFLKNKYDIEKVTDLTIDVRDKKKRLIPIEFRVWRMDYVFNPRVNVTEYAPNERIPVYLIGPGNRRPFSQAFRARNPTQIYQWNAQATGLPHEWHEQFFAKAASAFLTHQATAVDEVSLFAPLGLAPHIDVVHLHGASTGYIAKHLHDKRMLNQLGRKPPAVVYTMHNYLDESRYTHSIASINKFQDELRDQQHMQPYTRGSRVFMASLGMDHATMVTVVGEPMASDMVEGRLDFPLKELVMESVLRKAQHSRFYGISNGLDLTQLNPFTDSRLVTRKFGYPEYALDLIMRNNDQYPANVQQRIAWPLSGLPNDYLTTSKDRAKRFLVKRSLLLEEDLQRPLAVYVGTLDDATMPSLLNAARSFHANNVKFIVLAPESGSDQDLARCDQLNAQGDVIAMATPKEFRRWNIFARAAADFAFVVNEDPVGMPAAQGLWFGAPVIMNSNSVPAYLHDRPAAATWSTAEPERDIHIIRDKQTRIPTVTSSETYNAYLYTADEDMVQAVEDAVNDYKRNHASKVLREEFALRMIRAAYQLGWHRRDLEGPVHDYGRVYRLAIADRPLVSIARHEIDEEEALLRRLLRQRQRNNFHLSDGDA
ncbi:hypothetical protein O0I10_002411 [Lichtheimia ornata]|uniref:Starch synthase catalytic domain-containing protein n=1 Tax=Lichtheimia ornata TaxID=688661 RepID=A0AAD7VB45_9FUNG|nr:uncharacterized protein O0I10_002411 [Lichtheimia ornata]KAJ8661605.1 hypothetical protein O0I10_002411 [Lichtheimia ornata]